MTLNKSKSGKSRKLFWKFYPILNSEKKLMHKNAIKLEMFGVRGQFSHYKKPKTGEFSAIFDHKAGEFGDICESDWRFLTKNFC